MIKNKTQLTAVEQICQKHYDEELSDLAATVDTALEFMLAFGDTFYEQLDMRNLSDDENIPLLLFSRLFSDLRAAQTLARNGYANQAAALAANAYEVSFELSYCVDTPGYGTIWAEHRIKEKTPSQRKKRVLETFKNMGVPNPKLRLESEERIYTQLCMMKHSNPISQAHFGYIRSNDKTQPYMGPDPFPRSLRLSGFALINMVRWIFIGVQRMLFAWGINDEEIHKSMFIFYTSAEAQFKTLYEQFGSPNS